MGIGEVILLGLGMICVTVLVIVFVFAKAIKRFLEEF